MIEYYPEKFAFTADEAVKVARHMSGSFVLIEFPKVVREMQSVVTAYEPRESIVNARLMDAAIFAAGRLQGIREERERRRRKVNK